MKHCTAFDFGSAPEVPTPDDPENTVAILFLVAGILGALFSCWEVFAFLGVLLVLDIASELTKIRKWLEGKDDGP